MGDSAGDGPLPWSEEQGDISSLLAWPGYPRAQGCEEAAAVLTHLAAGHGP